MQGVHLANKLTQPVRARPDMDLHQLSLGMRVNGLVRERGFENRQPYARNADNLNSDEAQHVVVRSVTVGGVKEWQMRVKNSPTKLGFENNQSCALEQTLLPTIGLGARAEKLCETKISPG